MCFSMTGSFAAGVGLLLAGTYATRAACATDRSYVPFALTPVGFGIQQLLEGMVWMALQSNDPSAARTPALGFMFFSHLVWLFWVPFSVSKMERMRTRKLLLQGTSMVGLCMGAAMFLPFVTKGWYSVEVVGHSIFYGARLLFDQYVPRTVVNIVYGLVILVPLLVSSHKGVRRFGVVILASVAISLAFFLYAFTSVWCFFAAVLSVLIVWIVRAGSESPARNAGEASSSVS